MPHVVAIYPDVIGRDVCEEIIGKFEADPRRRFSHLFAGNDPGVRSGTLLKIGSAENWKDIKKLLLEKFSECLQDYARPFNSLEHVLREDCETSGFVVERVDPGQGFNWHVDSGPKNTHDRFPSVLYYLNDIDEGGRTEFRFQDFKFARRAGSLLMFPSHCTLKS